MEYAIGGQGGTSIVFLHGYSDSWFSFRQVAELVSDSFRVVLPTHRGHGESSKPESGYSIEKMAEDALMLMDHLDVRQAVLSGHSMGTFIALQIALSRPDRVLGVSLIGGAVSADKALLHDMAASLEGLPEPVEREFVEEFQRSTVASPVDENLMDTVIRESMKMPARLWKPILSGLIEYKPAKPVSAMMCPTMIHWGTEDEIFPMEDQDALRSALPHAAFHVYEGIGHGLHWENAARYVDDLKRFAHGLGQK